MKAQRDLVLNKGLSKEISASTKTVILSNYGSVRQHVGVLCFRMHFVVF